MGASSGPLRPTLRTYNQSVLQTPRVGSQICFHFLPVCLPRSDMALYDVIVHH